MSAVLDHRITNRQTIRQGKPCIEGRRIAVQDIVIWHERLGMSPDEIASEYDLSLSDIYIALAYYFANRALIDESIRDDDAFAQNLKKKSISVLQQKLKKLANTD